jgi:Zn-finger nucleic acid-binding protein
MLACPNDGSALVEVHVEGVVAHRCPQCHGNWLTRDGLKQIAAHHTAHPTAPTIGEGSVLDSSRKCPNDGCSMYYTEYTDAQFGIDQCANCGGVWLENTGLRDLIKHLDSENHEPSLSQQVMLFLYNLTERPPLI